MDIELHTDTYGLHPKRVGNYTQESVLVITPTNGLYG